VEESDSISRRGDRHYYYSPHDAPHNVLAHEIVLAARVQLRVVAGVVVALCEELCVRTAGRGRWGGARQLNLLVSS
jgi:hypothetical protein